MPVSYYKAVKYRSGSEKSSCREAKHKGRNTERERETTGIDVWHKPEDHYLFVGGQEKDRGISRFRMRIGPTIQTNPSPFKYTLRPPSLLLSAHYYTHGA